MVDSRNISLRGDQRLQVSETYPVRHLVLLCIGALSIIALLLIVSQVIIQHQISVESSDSLVINLAGRQRALSQSISKLALLITVPDSPASGSPRDELAKTLAVFEETHEGLEHGDSALGLPGDLSPEVLSLRNKLKPSYDTITSSAHFILTHPGTPQTDDVRAARNRIVATESTFYPIMNEIVSQLQKESSERVAKLKNVERGICAVALLVILGEGLFIYRPALRKLSESQRAQKATLKKVTELMQVQTAILDSASHAIISVDKNGIITTFNKAAELWFGYSARELIGKANPSIFHVPEEVVDRAKVLSRELGRAIKPGFETFVAKVAPGKPAENEWTFVRKDGARFPVWLSISVMADLAGEVSGYLGIITDLTERKKAEEAQRQDEARYQDLASRQQAILNSPNQALISTTVEGVVTSFNKTAEKWLGYTAAEIVGKQTPAIWHDREEVYARAQVLTRELGRDVKSGFDVFIAKLGFNKSDENEWTFIRKDGSRFPVLLSATEISSADGVTVGYLGVISDITERKRAQAALQASEERFRLIVDNVKDYALLMLDPDGKVISWNTGAERLKGYTAAEIIGQHFSRFYTVEDVARKHPENELRIAAEKGRYEEEGWRVRKDGTRFYANVVLTAVYDNAGILCGFAKVTRDVTEQKRYEKEILKLNEALESKVEDRTRQLSETEKRFRFLAEAMPQIVWTAQPDGSADYFNQQWFDYTGMTMEQTKDWGWTPVLHPDDLHDCIAQWKHACATGGKYDIKYRFKRASDGQYRWQLGRAFPLRDENGNITLWVGTCTDIDDLKKAEEAISQAKEELEKSELRFRTMANSIPQLSWVADADGFITWYNDRWYEYTGTTPKDMEGWGWQSVHDPEWLPKVMTGWTNSISSGKRFDMEFPLRGADGRFRQFLTRVFPFKDADGRLVQWFGTNTDIDDLKQAEERILRINEDLEKRVEERTKELQEKNIELLKAAQAKNSFLANMSHELRTPLNGIIGFSEILADALPGPVNPDQKEYLGDILNSSHHLLQLINDVLDLAKVEAGKMDLHPEAFSIVLLVEQVCSVISPLVMKKKIRLSTNIAPELDQVMLDQQRLKQILYNLLSNAVKFTDDQGVVEIMIAPLGTREFTIAVKDSGIGIKPENLKRLFQEFEQLDEGTTRRYQGTGLGLALTRKIAEMQGGSIKVESEFGKGATFTVTLPMIIEEVAA